MDTITFACGADGLKLAKRVVVRDGQIIDVEPSPQCSVFRFREETVHDLTSLMRAVWRAAQNGEIAVRGKPKASTGRRAVYDHAEKGAAGLDVVARRWVAFDWDGIPPADAVVPDLSDDPAERPDPLLHPGVGAGLALRRLPPAFRSVSCGWQISASAGFKPGFRLRTWHWLNHPTTGAELKGWCRPSIDRRLVDPVTLVEAQIHYLSIKMVGGADPCPQRFGILEQGKSEVAVPDIAGILRMRSAQERRDALATHGIAPDPNVNPAAAKSYAERRIAECIAAVRDAPDGTKHPTYLAEAARARALCSRFNLEWRPVRDRLRATYIASLDPAEERRRHSGSTEGVLRWVDARPT